MIVVKLRGGHGNQMFQYALARELQRRGGGDICLDVTTLLDRFPRSGVTRREYALDIFHIQPRFTLLSEIALRRSLPLLLMYGGLYLSRLRNRVGLQRLVLESSSRLSIEEVLRLKGDIYLDGYWQHPKYFEGSETILRQEFRVRRPLLPISQGVAASIEETDSVCLNVRRTDYVTLKGSIETHGFVGDEYYARAVSLLAPKLKQPHIFVTSDDIAWCRANLRYDYPTTFLGDEHHGYKFHNVFALMCRCKHFIISNSTFAWWAAWLGSSADKIVICPQRWYQDPHLDASDMMPKDWIRL